ncbi:MAG: cell division protein SepF, partial [Microthrixaceae bacterium]|nr:cell division protein SepF [Microthrixaceae bacterium]
LGPDEDYDDFEPEREPVDAAPVATRRVRPQGPPPGGQPVRRPVAPPQPDYGYEGEPEPHAAPAGDGGVVRMLPGPGGGAQQSPQSPPPPRAVPPREDRRPRSVVRPSPPAPVSSKPQKVTPDSFNEAQEIADVFKRRQPVIVNLEGADRDLSRRLIDFASGVCYGLGGTMERVGGQVFLLTPTDVEVSDDDKRRFTQRGGS